MFKVIINVDPKKSILDPQGKTVLRALNNLGFSSAEEVRIGKHIVVMLDVESENQAIESARSMCTALLFNPLTEEFTIDVEPC
ncbi:MAG: phosphoribosylformylglycinamidine synthase subunit PurS [Caldisericia bacterium]|nr:phosphoribosylformylglycinamidine synthase subunit PurS [Caldisericia bacterium]